MMKLFAASLLCLSPAGTALAEDLCLMGREGCLPLAVVRLMP